MFSRGDREKSLCRGSAERERTRLHACIEKLDLELPISNGLRLPDQLILGRTGEAALAPVLKHDDVAITGAELGMELSANASGYEAIRRV